MATVPSLEFPAFRGCVVRVHPSTGRFHAGGFLKDVRVKLALKTKRWDAFIRTQSAREVFESERARGESHPFINSVSEPRGMFVTAEVMKAVMNFVSGKRCFTPPIPQLPTLIPALASELTTTAPTTLTTAATPDHMETYTSVEAPSSTTPASMQQTRDTALAVSEEGVPADVVQRIVQRVTEQQQAIRVEERKIASDAHLESYRLIARLKQVTKQQRKAWREADRMAHVQWVLLRRISDQHKRLAECGAPVASLVPTIYRRVDGVPDVQFDFSDDDRDSDANSDEDEEERFANFLKEGMESMSRPTKKRKTN